MMVSYSTSHNLMLCLFFFFEDPPIPDDESLVEVDTNTQGGFSIQINSSLLNDTNGPITYVGVLVTSETPGRFLLWVRNVCNYIIL